METNHNMAMEMEMGGGSGGTPVSSRWNPTKEQIDMLESLYKQGIRTPNADQIQQITSRLKAYGHIEGKNVFYWFQNHKARQRQKQKQESMAYINRFLHMPHHHQPAVFAPPCPDVVCGPYYRAQNELGFYAPQCSKVLIPGGFVKRRSRNEKMDKTRFYAGPGYEPAAMAPHHVPHHECRNQGISITNESNSSGCGDNNDHETLTLFPLQPTGILQEKPATGNASEAGEGSLPFFNFFSGKGPCENL